MSNNLSIAVPTFNSSKYLKQCLDSITKINCVNEVVVNDDYSNELEFNKTKEVVDEMKAKNKKIDFILRRNDRNLGSFFNKVENVKLCKNIYVYQIDSDNFITKKSSKIIDDIMQDPDENYLYTPSKILLFEKNYFISKFNLKKNIKYSNQDTVLTIDDIKQSINLKKNIHGMKSIRWVLNTGNWIFKKDKYIASIENINPDHVSKSGDALIFTYYWYKSGNEIYLKKNFNHYHRLHRASNFSNHGGNSTDRINEYVSKFLKL